MSNENNDKKLTFEEHYQLAMKKHNEENGTTIEEPQEEVETEKEYLKRIVKERMEELEVYKQFRQADSSEISSLKIEIKKLEEEIKEHKEQNKLFANVIKNLIQQVEDARLY